MTSRTAAPDDFAHGRRVRLREQPFPGNVHPFRIADVREEIYPDHLLDH
jgi:hypothetical protein